MKEFQGVILVIGQASIYSKISILNATSKRLLRWRLVAILTKILARTRIAVQKHGACY